MDQIKQAIQKAYDEGKLTPTEFLKANVQLTNVMELAEFIKGGKRAVEGEERVFGGNRMKKQGGKWVYVGREHPGVPGHTMVDAHLHKKKEEEKKKDTTFDRGEKHHSEQVAHYTKLRDMHQDIVNHITSKHGEMGRSSNSSIWRRPATEFHEEAIKTYQDQLDRLARIKLGDGLLSIKHLKVGDKFTAIKQEYSSEKGWHDGKAVQVKVTKVDSDGITYMTEDGHSTHIDMESGRATGTITYTHHFSKWKPSGAKSEYDNMTPQQLLQTLGIDNVSRTHYTAKRGDVFDRQTVSVADQADRLRALATKHGKPTKVTYEKIEPDRDEMDEGRRSEREYSYTKGTRVVLHWGDHRAYL